MICFFTEEVFDCLHLVLFNAYECSVASSRHFHWGFDIYLSPTLLLLNDFFVDV